MAVNAPATERLRKTLLPRSRWNVGPPFQVWPLLSVSAAEMAASVWADVYLFGPTRLNVSADPSRAAVLREPVSYSVLEGLSDSGIELSARFGGLSKSRANWIRLSTLLVGPAEKELFLRSLAEYPSRAVGREPPASLYSPRGFGLHPAESFALKALEEALLLPSVLGELLSPSSRIR